MTRYYHTISGVPLLPIPSNDMLDNHPPPLEILREDGPLLVVNKPPGISTQGVPGKYMTLESQVREYIKTTFHKPGNVYLGIPHRLDRPTSGVIVFARNSKTAARLAEQFAERSVIKEYLAIVEGEVSPETGSLSDWLLKDAERAFVRIVPEGTARAKFAELEYRVIAIRSGRTLLHLMPRTGRMHQLRVQLAARGWPVVGDRQYGIPQSETQRTIETEAETNFLPRLNAIALHAWRLTLKHPIRYDTLTLQAPPPSSWPEDLFSRSDISAII